MIGSQESPALEEVKMQRTKLRREYAPDVCIQVYLDLNFQVYKVPKKKVKWKGMAEDEDG